MVLAAAMMMMHGLYRLILTMSGVHRRWTSAHRHLCCAEMSFAEHGTLMHTWLNRQELTMPHVDCLHLIVPPTMQLWIICRNCLVIFSAILFFSPFPSGVGVISVLRPLHTATTTTTKQAELNAVNHESSRKWLWNSRLSCSSCVLFFSFSWINN